MKIIAHLKTWIKLHRFFATIIAIALLGGGYLTYGKFTPTTSQIKYFLTAVERGTVISSISGSGQVAASNQITVRAKASGEIISVGAKIGMPVVVGTTLARIDRTDAERAVANAQVALDQAKLTLERMKGLSTAEGTIRGDKAKAADVLKKEYEDGFNIIASSFLDLPDIMSGMQSIFYSTNLGISGQSNIDFYPDAIQKAQDGKADSIANNFRDVAASAYRVARTAYDANFNDYKSASRFSGTETIEKLIDETYATSQLIAEAVKNANNLIQLYKDRLAENNITPKTAADTQLSLLSSYTGKLNSYLSSLLSTQTSLQANKEALISVGFDLADQNIAVAKAEQTLSDAQIVLSECAIRSPIGGTVASISIKIGDMVSSGSTVGTVISNQRVAEITLNEVDVAKVQIGQKVTLTFDALEGISITGTVSEIDVIGTVSQGVVSYAVKIEFNTQDSRIKPGMSVAAAIITDIKQDVLSLPNESVKSQGDEYYVERLDAPSGISLTEGVVSPTAPRRQTVQVGIANDSVTEIIAGLVEGDSVVLRSVSAETQTTTQTTTQGGAGGLRLPRLGGGGH